MTLVESRDKCVREAAPVLKTGRKWAAKKAVEDAKAALRIGDIMGQVQHGRGGLGLSSAPPTWHKAAPAQRRKLVVNEVQKQEERMRCIKAISQAKQGEWMRWESVEQRKIGWQDLWSMEQSRINIICNAAAIAPRIPGCLPPRTPVTHCSSARDLLSFEGSWLHL
ncbi:UNVERIFIED_CONTAM: hypothetical protein FKN15_040092 [Acipenser sinensis]